MDGTEPPLGPDGLDPLFGFLGYLNLCLITITWPNAISINLSSLNVFFIAEI